MSRHLDLRLLESFLVVAEELSFTQAARRLHMSQPPLSLQIKQLEAKLDTLLFERNKRSVQLTAAGEVLREESERLFAIERRARQRVTKIGKGEDAGHIAVGFTAVAAIDLVPALLREFSAQVPDVLYSLWHAPSEAQIAALLRKELDIALVRPPVADTRLDARCLFAEPHVLAAPAQHPLASRRSVNVRHLHGEMLAMFDRRAGRYAHDLMVGWMGRNNVVPARTHDVVQHQAMMALVSAGIALALVPASVSLQPVNGVVFRRFTGPQPPPIELWMALRKDASNPMAARFAEILAHHAKHYRATLPK